MKNRYGFVLAILLALFLLIGCSTKRELRLFHSLDQNNTEVNSTKVLASKRIRGGFGRYIIKPNDRLQVIVYGYQEFTPPPSGILVNSRGIAILPLIGGVKVAGLDETQAAHKIQRLMRHHISDVVVSVEVPNKVVYVIGDVNKPGPVKLPSGKIRLLQAIASAGGFKDTASRDALYLVRETAGKAKLTKLSLSSNEALTNSFKMLKPGDILYIAPNTTATVNMGTMQTLKIIGNAMSPVAAMNSLAN